MYEYHFINKEIRVGIRDNSLKNIEECEMIIVDMAKEGWRFVQLITVPNEKAGVYMPKSYKLIFERQC